MFYPEVHDSFKCLQRHGVCEEPLQVPGESLSLQAAGGKFLAEADATEFLKERLTRAETRSLEEQKRTGNSED